MVDDNIKEALQRYVEHRIPTGGFLTAVLENNLMTAMGRADTINRHNLYDICTYIYNELPGHIHGSPEKVKKHLEINNIMENADYILVQWPDSQMLMEEDWFQEECFLAIPIHEEHEWVGSSAYFVPKKRLEAE